MLTRRRAIRGMLGSAAVSALGLPTLASARSGFFAERKLRVGLQLYTLGALPVRDLEGCLKRVEALGYREIELPGMVGKTPAELRAAADRAGLRIVSLHLNAGSGAGNTSLGLDSDPDRIAGVLDTIGAEAAILSMVPFPPGFRPSPGETFQVALARSLREAGDDHWRRTASLLNRCGTALKSRGFAMGYHNHNLEFAPIGRTTGFDILLQETDPHIVSFEVDIGWVASAGVDPVDFVKRHAGRLRWMHVKDVKATTRANFALAMDPTEVGSGSVDWRHVLPAAWKSGVRHFFVEQEPPFSLDRFESIARSLAYLRTEI